MEEKVKFGFGVRQEICEPETFDSIDDLLAYAQGSWESKDGNPFDDDCDYSGVIFVGVVRHYAPSDFAPSLDRIADAMTDSFYCECNIDDDGEVCINKREEAEKALSEFINEYFELPCTYVGSWFGEYSLVDRKWIEKRSGFEKYVKSE